MKSLRVAVALLVTSMTGSSAALAKDNWPNYTPDPAWRPQVEAALKEYHSYKYDYRRWTQDYKSDGDFLNYSRNIQYRNTKAVHLDDDGIPTIIYGGKFEYNPVTLIEFSLTEYGQHRRDARHRLTKFYKAIDKLISMQSPDGAFRYPFSWEYYRNQEPYKPGWVSGMAQGLSLTALSRAYRLSQDRKYLDAGNRAFKFLIRPVAQGGTMEHLTALDPSLKDHIIFEEYISTPPNYTLNGYMYALLGVYDWIGAKKSAHQSNLRVRQFFNSGIETLVGILPYYEIGGFSAYDLTHITFKTTPHIGVQYHYFHIALLHALYSVTSEPVFKKYEKQFIAEVEDKSDSAINKQNEPSASSVDRTQ